MRFIREHKVDVRSTCQKKYLVFHNLTKKVMYVYLMLVVI